MDKTITFVTGNRGKLEEVAALLPQVKGVSIDLPEIQSLDTQEIVAHKLVEATKRCDGPLIVDDTALFCECLSKKDGGRGLPGPMVKWFLQTITNEGIARIAHELKCYAAEGETTIGYADKQGKAHFFTGRVKGTIVFPQGTRGFGWDHIFIPDGHTKTFAAMGKAEKNRYSPRAKALQGLYNKIHNHL